MGLSTAPKISEHRKISLAGPASQLARCGGAPASVRSVARIGIGETACPAGGFNSALDFRLRSVRPRFLFCCERQNGTGRAHCQLLYSLSLSATPIVGTRGEIRFLRRRSIVNLPPVQTETAVRLTAIYCRSRFFTAVFYGCFLPLSSIDHTSHSPRSFTKPSTTLSS